MNVYRKNKYIIFTWMLLSVNVIFWLVAIATRGNSLDLYFLSDPKDTYMDYFNMIANIEGLDPYHNNANYPAFTFLIWRLLYRIIPWNEFNTNGFFLRETQAAQLGFILFMLFCIIMIWELLKISCLNDGIYKILFPISILTSGPILFTIERGNIIILSFIFSFVFILLYDLESKKIRYFAYICLAMAAAIKIYPAVLGVLVILKKRYKESVNLIIIGLFFFIAPFFLFDGFNSLIDMIKGIFLSSSGSLTFGYGYNFSFSNFIRILLALSGNYSENIHQSVLFLPLIISLLIFICNKEEWKKVFALVLIMTWIPSFSYTYVLIFMIIPLILFLKSSKSSFDCIYTIFFVIIMSTWCLPKMGDINYFNGDEFKLCLTYGMLLINIIMLLFSILLIYDGIKNKISKINE